MGGLVLDAAVRIYSGFVVFQPIINGIGGNLVSVQASKISTMLHQSSIIGIIPPHAKIFEMPWRALFHGGKSQHWNSKEELNLNPLPSFLSAIPYAKTARILILMSIPGQILFIFAADYMHMYMSTIGVAFVLSYLFVSLIQIMILLYTAHVIIHAMWRWKIDPDNSAIPYLTALGDLLGSSLLMLAFQFLKTINQSYADRQEVVGPPLTDIDGIGDVLGAYWAIARTTENTRYPVFPLSFPLIPVYYFCIFIFDLGRAKSVYESNKCETEFWHELGFVVLHVKIVFFIWVLPFCLWFSQLNQQMNEVLTLDRGKPGANHTCKNNRKMCIAVCS